MPPDLDHIVEDLRSIAMPIDELNVDPNNARAHDERNIDAICASLKNFKQRHPVVVQKQGMIVRAGNGRVVAAKRLGWTHVAAVVVDESEVEATAFAIADNRTAELATWDWPVLAGSLKTLDEAGFPLGELKLDFENLLDGNWQPSDHDPEGLDAEQQRTVKLTPEQWSLFLRAADGLEEKDLGMAVARLAAFWVKQQ